jgi:hypothetical protein
MPKILEDKPYASFTNRQLAYAFSDILDNVTITPRQVSKWRMGQIAMPNKSGNFDRRLTESLSIYPIKHPTK